MWGVLHLGISILSREADPRGPHSVLVKCHDIRQWEEILDFLIRAVSWGPGGMEGPAFRVCEALKHL